MKTMNFGEIFAMYYKMNAYTLCMNPLAAGKHEILKRSKGISQDGIPQK